MEKVFLNSNKVQPANPAICQIKGAPAGRAVHSGRKGAGSYSEIMLLGQNVVTTQWSPAGKYRGKGSVLIFLMQQTFCR